MGVVEEYKDEGRRTIQMNRWSVSGGWHFILARGAGHCLGSLSDSLSPFSVLTPSPRDRTITSFLFSFNYRCQGVTASPHTFSLFLTFLHYSFIYSNYPHHVNLSLPLISLVPPSLLHFFSRRRKQCSRFDARLVLLISFSSLSIEFLDELFRIYNYSLQRDTRTVK